MAVVQQIKYCKALSATFTDCFIKEKDNKVNILNFFQYKPFVFYMNLQRILNLSLKTFYSLVDNEK